MNATSRVHDVFLCAAVGALIGLVYGSGIYAEVGLWSLALCVGGGSILGAAASATPDIETQDSEISEGE